MNGRLVGINTAIFSRVGRLERHRLRHPLQHGAGRRRSRRKTGGRVRAAVGRRELPGGDRRTSPTALGIDTPRGALVADVDQGQPGARGRAEDAATSIVAIDGVDVDDPSALNYRLATKGIGATAKLGIVRDGKHYVATLALEAAPETVPRDEIDDRRRLAACRARPSLNLSPAVAEELAYPRRAERA